MKDATEIPLRPTQGSSTPHILLAIFQVGLLISPPFPGRRWFAILTLSSLGLWSQLSPWTHDPGAANFASLAWPHWLSTIEKFLLDGPTPEAALWPVDKPGVALTYAPFGLWKLKWAMSLIINLRGVRYNFQVKNVPKARFTAAQPWGRVRFLLWQCMELAYLIIMGDLVAQLSNKLFFPPGSVDSTLLSARDSDWRMSFLKALVFGTGPYLFINMQYVLPSIICVALHVSKPEDWPPLFGRLAEATTVRAFWGKFWHQMIRKPLTRLTGLLVDFLGIKKGTTLSSYTHLWLSFAISGFMHAASLRLMPCPANVPEWDRWYGLVSYFMWQALAITVEDFVIFLWRRVFGEGSGTKSLWKRIVGYVWVVCSFWYSLPLAADVLLKVRMGETSPFPWTLWGGVIERVLPA